MLTTQINGNAKDTLGVNWCVCSTIIAKKVSDFTKPNSITPVKVIQLSMIFFVTSFQLLVTSVLNRVIWKIEKTTKQWKEINNKEKKIYSLTRALEMEPLDIF